MGIQKKTDFHKERHKQYGPATAGLLNGRFRWPPNQCCHRAILQRGSWTRRMIRWWIEAQNIQWRTAIVQLMFQHPPAGTEYVLMPNLTLTKTNEKHPTTTNLRECKLHANIGNQDTKPVGRPWHSLWPTSVNYSCCKPSPYSTPVMKYDELKTNKQTRNALHLHFCLIFQSP